MHSEEKICEFGLHRGEPYSKLPASFLNWMIGMKHQHAGYAAEELQRRMQAVNNGRLASMED